MLQIERNQPHLLQTAQRLALPGLFGPKAQRDADAAAARERALFEQIGRLEMENAWRKKLGPLDSGPPRHD